MHNRKHHRPERAERAAREMSGPVRTVVAALDLTGRFSLLPCRLQPAALFATTFTWWCGLSDTFLSSLRVEACQPPSGILRLWSVPQCLKACEQVRRSRLTSMTGLLPPARSRLAAQACRLEAGRCCWSAACFTAVSPLPSLPPVRAGFHPTESATRARIFW